MRRLQVTVNYGGKLTHEHRIYPGVYEETDASLYGLAAFLVETGRAVWLDTPANVGYAVVGDDEAPIAVPYAEMTVAELRAECERRGIDLDSIEGTGKDGALLKADLVLILEGDDEDNAG